MNCKQCNSEFEAKRADALFCSDSCRKAYKRNKSDIIPDKIKSDTIPYVRDKPANFGQPDCECWHCRAVRSNCLKVILNHGPYKPASRLSKAELNRVPLPGDVDYKGVYDTGWYDEHRGPAVEIKLR